LGRDIAEVVAIAFGCSNLNIVSPNTVSPAGQQVTTQHALRSPQGDGFIATLKSSALLWYFFFPSTFAPTVSTADVSSGCISLVLARGNFAFFRREEVNFM